MLTNFGPVIQVKHLTLTPEKVEDIATGIAADSIIIVCLDAEKNAILTLLTQLGMETRIQGIITLSDLENWYKMCLSEKYHLTLGGTLLSDLIREFDIEFPSSQEIEPFIKERGYDAIGLPQDWDIIYVIDSCFWHGCQEHVRMPKSNREYWINKIENNRKRDAAVNEYYKERNRKILRVWEHQIKMNFNKTVNQIKTLLEPARNVATD